MTKKEIKTIRGFLKNEVDSYADLDLISYLTNKKLDYLLKTSSRLFIVCGKTGHSFSKKGEDLPLNKCIYCGFFDFIV